jgi:hypothetical protein
MASKAPSPQSDPNYITPEECREMFASFFSEPPRMRIPDWQMQILEERITNYCENGVHVTTFEEFEKELLEGVPEELLEELKVL